MNYPVDFISSVLKIAGLLAGLIGGLYGCLYLIKRMQQIGFGKKTDELVRVLCIRSIGVKKQIALVEVPGSILVIGMAGDRLQLLDKIIDINITDTAYGNNNQPSSSDQVSFPNPLSE